MSFLNQKMHVCACLVIFFYVEIWALWRGQDVNWDFQNYHDYDVFALLHWRYARDVAPAGPQTYLNPLPYLLPYGLRHALPPIVAGMIIAASQALPLILAWFLASYLAASRAVALLAGIGAVSGAMVLTEIGTSFSDLILTLPILTALLFLLRMPQAPVDKAGLFLALAGLASGATIGAKPTNLFYLPALAIVVAMRQASLRHALWSLGYFLPSLVAGALLSDGAWAWFLWHRYGNPIFPFLNTVFRSHSAALVNFGDPRYHFSGLRNAVATPFRVAFGTMSTGEVPIRDARIACGVSLGVTRLARRAVLRRPDALDAVSAFVVTGSAGWLILYPIQRYAIGLEMVSGLLAILIAARLPGRISAVFGPAALTALLVITTLPGDYFHRAWRPAYVPVVPPAIGPSATYGLLAQPLAYWISVHPRPAHAFGLLSTLLETGGVLQKEVDHIIADPSHRLWLLNLDEELDPQIRAEMSIHGMVLASPCFRSRSAIWIDTVFCSGAVVGKRRFAASDLHLGDTVSFSSAGTGLLYEVQGFEAAEADGAWATGSHAVLAMHLSDEAQNPGAVLTLHVEGVAGAPDHKISLSLDDGPEVTKQAVAAGSVTTIDLCLLPTAENEDGVSVVRFTTRDSRSLAQLGQSAEARALTFKLLDMRLHARERDGAPECSNKVRVE